MAVYMECGFFEWLIRCPEAKAGAGVGVKGINVFPEVAFVRGEGKDVCIGADPEICAEVSPLPFPERGEGCIAGPAGFGGQ